MIDHDAITAQMGWKDGKCQGTHPNPFEHLSDEYTRIEKTDGVRGMLSYKIRRLYEPRFITDPKTARLIEVLASAYDARNILEIGCYSCFTTLHLLRSIVGKPGAKVTAIDARPAHDAEWFALPQIAPYFRFIQEWTPKAITDLQPEIFDFVFIDSDHTANHTRKEVDALLTVTKPGSVWLFHDVPEWQTPTNKTAHPARDFVQGLVKEGLLAGLCLPTGQQADCEAMFGPGYPKQVNPGLGIFVRQ